MIERFSTSVKGIAPLLQHRYAVADDKPLDPTKPAIRGARIDLEEMARKALYISNGIVFQPAEHFEAAMVKAATTYKIPGAGQKTYKDAFLGGIVVDPRQIPHKIQEWVTDIRPIVIQRARVLGARPRFDRWELEFIINLTDERIEECMLKQILSDAGQFVGVGDFRPKFGRFEITKFEKMI